MNDRTIIKNRRKSQLSSVEISAKATNTLFVPVEGIDKIDVEDVPTPIHTKHINICATPAHENKSPEELRFKYYLNHLKPSWITAANFSLPLNMNFSFGVLTVPNTPINSFASENEHCPSQSLTTLANNFALAVQGLNDCVNGMNKSSTVAASIISPFTIRSCTDCSKLPQMQCLHCSKQVCMECAQKHVKLVDEQIQIAEEFVTNKLSILDRLVIIARERVNAEREKIIEQANVERDQAYMQINELYHQQMKHMQDSGFQLRQLSLDKVLPYIQRMKNNMEALNEDNQQLFHVACTAPRIQVKHKR
ncbi:unnamed protein product [Adineta ricciae]|uniref:Uncharacterized protein n=1 Tax=Adineta ricciae TaxID=249248 RepID=A0A816FGR4_ADIRI|nr:unnamed protein product [Adineta ricciae]